MKELKALYDASAQDLRFGIGVMATDNGEHAPVICIHYANWPLDILESIRESMASGITLNRVERNDGSFNLILSTIERAVVQAMDRHQTDIIRFPSWDARLEGIEAGVLEQFDKGYELLGRFLLIVQTNRWMFESVVMGDGTLKMGNIQPKSVSIPIDG